MTKSHVEDGLILFLLVATTLVHFKLPLFDLSIHNFLIPLISLILIFINFRSGERKVEIDRRIVLALGVLIVWVIVVAVLSPYRDTAIRYTVKYLICYPLLLIGLLVLSRRGVGRNSMVILVFLWFLAIFGILEALFPFNGIVSVFRNEQSLTVYPRIASLLQWPNQFGVLMVVGLVIAILQFKRKSISKHTTTIIIIFFLANIVLSASRNAYLMLFIALFYLCARRQISLKQTVFVVTLFIVLLLTFPISTNQLGIRNSHYFPIIDKIGLDKIGVREMAELATPVQTMAGRLDIWKVVFSEIGTHPIKGQGLGVFNTRIAEYRLQQEGLHAHNLFLNVIVDTGFVGLIFAGWLFYVLVRNRDFRCDLWMIPVTVLLASNMLDFFMLHDYPFTAVLLIHLTSESW